LLEGFVGEQPLALCDLVAEGPPHWVIYGRRLKVIDGDLEWRWIDQVRQNSSISGEQWLQMRRDLDLDGDLAPAYEWRPLAAEMTPVLQLRDQRGCFASLCFDYGGSVGCDPKGEAAAKADLVECGYEDRGGELYCPLDRVAQSLQLLIECGWRCTTKEGGSVVVAAEPDIEVVEERGRFVATGTVEGEPIGAALATLESGSSLLPLPGGAAAVMPAGLLGSLIEGQRVADRIVVRRNQLTALKEVLAKDLRSQVSTDYRATEPTSGFTGSLRPYQLDGLSWLCHLHRFSLGGILADEMGLGKTVQMIAFLSHLSGLALIVVPTSLLFNWRREIERFLPSMEVVVHHGPDRGGLPASGVVLTSYATLRLDLDLFTAREFELIALDEAQAIKNPDSQTARAAFSLKGRVRVAITGTPIENSWQDLWSLMRFAQADLLGERAAFLARPQRAMAPFLLRREKREVAADLPPKIEQEVWIEWDPEERRLYDELYAAVRGRLLERVSTDGSVSEVEILEGLLRLRQLCCHPSLVEQHLSNEVSRQSSKLARLLDDVGQTSGKLIIYSQFTSMLGLIERELGEPSLRLDGQTKDRAAVVDHFQGEGGARILLVSLKAGGVGLNLTAAQTVFLYEPWWNEAVENQAIDRAHRMGQSGSVLVKRYLVAGTIEEQMRELKGTKAKALGELFELG